MPNLRRIPPLATAVVALSLAIAPGAAAAGSHQAGKSKISGAAHQAEARELHRRRAAKKAAHGTHKPSRSGNSWTSTSPGTGGGDNSVGSGSPVSTPTAPAPVKSPVIPTKPTTPVTTPITTPVTTPVTTTPPPTTPVTETGSVSPLFAGSTVRAFPTNHSAPGAISEVTDPLGSGAKVIQMSVSNKDVYPITPTENPRAELTSQPVVAAGQEIWLHTSFLIPADYPTVPNGGWVSLVSFYGAPFNGPSPFHLELDGDQLQWQRNGTYGFDVPYKSTLVKGQWNDVLVHEKFATEGFLELWINGQPINFFTSGGYNPSHHPATTKLEMATMDSSNNGGPNSAKIMQYRQLGMFENGTMYFSGLQVGASRSSVGA
jgi:Polysaccharide lyase